MGVAAALPLTTFSIVMTFDEERLPTALDLLLGVVEPTRVKRGCASCRVERDAVDRQLVHYSEEWTSPDALRRHVRSREFWQVLFAMDLASEEPAVSLGDAAVRHGIGLLSELCGGAGTGPGPIEPGRTEE